MFTIAKRVVTAIFTVSCSRTVSMKTIIIHILCLLNLHYRWNQGRANKAAVDWIRVFGSCTKISCMTSINPWYPDIRALRVIRFPLKNKTKQAWTLVQTSLKKILWILTYPGGLGTGGLGSRVIKLSNRVLPCPPRDNR